MAGTQELTRRIKSVKSTRKITRAMQMVSAAKMRKSQMQALASRTYASLAWELIGSLGISTSDQPVLKTHADAAKVLVVAVSTNRGLVGSFNTNLFGKLKEIEASEGGPLELIVMGRKLMDISTRTGKNIVAEFPKADGPASVEGVYPIATQIVKMYETGQYKKVYILYNHFVSTLVQKPTAKLILPFSDPHDPNSIPATQINSEPATRNRLTPIEYEFEPTPQAVLEHLIPRILESQLYQAIVESDASEHSARMVMMKNATEAAGDLIDDLTLTYNQLRQNKITTELSEITAGKIALEK